MRKLKNLSLDKNPRTINKNVIVLGFFISILICNGIWVDTSGIKSESRFQETTSAPPQSAASLSVSNTWDYDDPTGARDEPRSSSMVLNPSSSEEDGYFIGETSGAFYSHNRNSRILRYNTSGNVQWGATMSGGAIYAWSEVGSLSDQEVILAAQQYQGDFIRFQRYDSSGATSGITWDYNPSENVWLSGMTSGDAIWVVGQKEMAVKSLFLLKLDPSGSTTIAKTWNNGSELWPAKVVSDGMGGVYVTGMEVISSNHHLFLAHFDQNGDLIDHITMAGIRDLYGNDIDFDGTYIHIIGGQEETTTDIYDLYVWTFDISLILQNSQLIDGYETSRPSLFNIVEGHLFHHADYFIKVVDATAHDFVFSALVPDGSMGQSRFFHMDYETYSIDAGMNYDVINSHDNQFHIERTWYGALFFIGHQWTAYGDHPIIRSLNMSFSFTVDTGMPYAFEDHNDNLDPILTNVPIYLTVGSGYTEQTLSWTITDSDPNTYTIELNSSEIVVEPTIWTSNQTITYHIPDGFDIGVYIYTVNFTDDYGNSITDSVTFTVEDDGGGISGANFEMILILSIGTVVSIIILKKKNFRSNLA